MNRGAPLLNRERAERVMDDEGLDILVASTPQNVEYVANYHSHGQWLMPASHTLAVLPRRRDLPITLVVSRGELDRVAEDGASVARVAPYGKFIVAQADGAALDGTEELLLRLRDTQPAEGPAEALAAVMADYGLPRPRIGLDGRGLLPSIRAAIAELSVGADIVDGYGPLQRIRMVKTTAEVERLEEAVRVAETALTATVAAFAPGITERQLVAVYERTVLEHGARPTFNHILIGRRGALSNGGASDAGLEAGDVVRFDVGCTVGFYNSDIARTAVFGRPDPKLRAYYDAILAGEEAALAKIRPGVTADELFRTAVKATREGGIAHYDRNHVGHGIGIELYDPPVITATTTAPLEEGMVLNLETPYYELGWGGIQVEDTFVVGTDGTRLFTRTPRTLIEV